MAILEETNPICDTGHLSQNLMAASLPKLGDSQTRVRLIFSNSAKWKQIRSLNDLRISKHMSIRALAFRLEGNLTPLSELISKLNLLPPDSSRPPRTYILTPKSWVPRKMLRLWHQQNGLAFSFSFFSSAGSTGRTGMPTKKIPWFPLRESLGSFPTP